ncbi:fibrillin-2 isoform X2 [Exaiptasia diaphana]|nr:fibrillin-2 isoform X2 [Exaiptasia diaphana]
MKTSLNGLLWHGYRESNQSKEMILPGNNDSTNVSYNILNGSCSKPLKAQFVRIYPVKWLNNICMRIGLFGVPSTCSLSNNCCITNESDIKNSTSPCPRGFYRDGNICSDIDECISNITCRANSTCVNIPGSFNCTCLLGYHGNASKCIDINECATANHSCSTHAQCINVPGSYTCRCTSGYHGSGHKCLDVDECGMNLRSCHKNASCTNTPGSYTCDCKNGYEGDGLNCKDVDECKRSHICPRHAVCTNLPGSFYCACTRGYRSSSGNCTADSVAGQFTHRRYLGIAIGLPVIVIVVVISVSLAYIVTRRRRKRVVRRPKPSNQTSSRPPSTVIGQIDKLLFDDDRKLRDSVSLNSLQFSIPSVHPSLTALNNITINNTKTSHETL